MFSRGRLDISVERARYAAGDTISGTVTLTPKKLVKARKVAISLVGEYSTTVISRRVGPRGVSPVHPVLSCSDVWIGGWPCQMRLERARSRMT
jgi:hypothetical protein